MTISSMTGFARASGADGGWSWTWEIRSVNGKSLDLRLRLPPGFEHLDMEIRQRLQAVIKRGSLQVGLAVENAASPETVTVNLPLLKELAKAAENLRQELDGPPLRAEQLLALRGVLDVQRAETTGDGTDRRDKAMLASLDTAVAALAKARGAEGERLHVLLSEHLTRIETLTGAARDNPARAPDAIRQRLKDQVARLMETGHALDEARLHQEAVLVATRSDIQEELDRLTTHISAARELLSVMEPVGRKFDFLAQEFNREANTLCSKAIDKSLTAIGLDLKTAIDQMREQVQNIE
jgi:uncharacterized protein (TIGR00255 family)